MSINHAIFYSYRTDISFISRRWRLRGRPTYCILITEENMRDHQFAELLTLLLEIRNLKVDNVKISLGRLQNLLCSACIEHLDFSSNFDVNELDIEPFTQVQHNLYDDHSMIEMCKVPKIRSEDVQDFTVSQGLINLFFCLIDDDFLFQSQFQHMADEEIQKVILESDHLYKRIQLLGILLQRHDENYLLKPHLSGKIYFLYHDNYVW